MTGDSFRDSMQYLLIGEILIVTFSAISLSASAIAKEREEGSLDLLLTTAITPKLYLGGKMRGLVMHLLPMVLVPCITMMAIGVLVLLSPEKAVVSDAFDVTNSDMTQAPLALFLPALLFPIVFIPYIAFCLTLGLLWSMRSKGTIGSIVSTLILIGVITGGLSMCMFPVQGVMLLGVGFSALSPFNDIFATLSPAKFLHTLLDDGVQTANISMGVASILSGGVWMLLSFGLLRSMSASFVTTVRRLAGG
jgi:hypothetical protein